jgi:hypothetical protein
MKFLKIWGIKNMKNGMKWVVSLFKRNDSQENLLNAFKNIFGKNKNYQYKEDAKLILFDLANYCNVLNTSFVGKDPLEMAFNEGARDVFLHILEMAEIDMFEFLEIIEKIKKEDK